MTAAVLAGAASWGWAQGASDDMGYTLPTDGLFPVDPAVGWFHGTVNPWWLVTIAGILLFALWLARWVDEDSRRVGIHPMNWNYMTMGGCFALLAAFLVTPLYISLPGAAVMVTALLKEYVPLRNRKVLPTRRLFTKEHRTALWTRFLGGFGIKPKGVEKRLAKIAKTHLPVALFMQSGRVASSAEVELDEEDPLTTVKEVFEQAVRRTVRDIIVGPTERGEEMSFRIDGVTYAGVRLEAAKIGAFAGQVRTLVEPGSADPHFRVAMPTIGKRFTVRVRSRGEGDEETLLLRLCADVEPMRRFDGLGLSEGASAKLRKALEEGRGLIVVASPVGMGARTTTYAALDLMDPFSRNIVTFERPVTGTLASIEQNDMDKLGRPLSEVLQEKLRQDVDVIMLSEIPDEATALVALTAGEREHLVIARMTLPDSVSAVEHLLGMGVDPAATAKGLHTVAAERLVRVLCERCRAQVTPSAELVHRIGKDPSQVEFLWEESEGCEACGMTGFHGRTGIFEIWQPGEESRRLIAAKASAEQLHAAARHDGIQTLQQAGLEKALEGTTSLKEIARAIKHQR